MIKVEKDAIPDAAEEMRAVGENASAPTSQAVGVLHDVVDGARASYLWSRLGWQDIRQRYRRSKIGPFWLTISMGVMVGGIGVLYAGLFKINVSDYLPFIALGFIVWGLISGLVNDGCAAFIGAEGIIKQVSLPLSVHVYRIVWRNLIIFCHNILIFFIVAIVFSIWPGWSGLLIVPGLALICLNGAWAGLLFGLVSARFRDVPQIVASIMQVFFFLTPIIWKPELLPGRSMVLELNPFFYFVELVRGPLLGHPPGLNAWFVVLGITVGGWIVTLAVYRRFSWRVAYWV